MTIDHELFVGVEGLDALPHSLGACILDALTARLVLIFDTLIQSLILLRRPCSVCLHYSLSGMPLSLVARFLPAHCTYTSYSLATAITSSVFQRVGAGLLQRAGLLEAHPSLLTDSDSRPG